jgi:hypothetical protein
MMDIKLDMIDAYIDGEIKDELVKQDVLSRIQIDNNFAIEYRVHSLVKNLVKEKLTYHQTPARVRAKILKSIGSTTKVHSEKKSFFADLFERPSFSFATALVVVLAIALIILNRPGIVEKKDFAVEQLGSKNMFLQAKNNFNAITTGQLLPQLTSQNADEIKNFFKDNGVKYSTLVPNVTDWNLLGAVVSEDQGEKFAHHVYVSEDGKLAYLFQVDESYLYEHEIISLSEDLIKYLDEGNCYSYESEGSVTLFTKMDNNICAVVSNGNPKEIENIFCSL